MGLIAILKGFFEESEEELKEEIKEAEKIKKEAENKLKDIKKRKHIKKKKKPINKKLVKKWLIISGIILLLIISWWGIQKYISLPKPFKYACKEMNPCLDCLVAASCITFEESPEKEYMYFTIENKNNAKGNCIAQISVEQENSVLSNKSYKLAALEANEIRAFKIPIDLPDGVSQISVTPNCEWE